MYINQGDLSFQEQAFSFGLLDISHSTQASFFDYDRDGDLDLYMLNHNIERLGAYDFKNPEPFRDEEVGDKLFRNDDGQYVEVSKEAGIIGTKISYGLGVMTGDINRDGWPDIYVCNDFGERDYLYLNNGDGTFREQLKESVDHIPYYSMGGDLADINNDGWLDIMTLDMTAKDNFGQKANMNDMNPGKFWYLVDAGVHYQYMINCLQLNRGAGVLQDKGLPQFSEISMMAGVAYTDWSWGPLFADFDNDGWKDLFISNGYRVDISNKDYVNWYKQREQKLNQIPPAQRNFAQEFQEALSKLTSEKVPNYMYRNKGDLTFEDVSQTWGLDQPSFSNGLAYADLDNDGDLDLVVNNLDQQAFIYENHASEQNDNHFLRIRCEGMPKNPNGIGAQLTVHMGDTRQYQELYVNRGFQSSVEPLAHVGLGKYSKVEKIEVVWPDGKKQTVDNPDIDRLITIHYQPSESEMPDGSTSSTRLFKDITNASGIQYRHEENEYDDFAREVLLPHKMSQFGPALAVGDIDGDGLDDFFAGGAAGKKGVVYRQNQEAEFEVLDLSFLEEDKAFEDIDALFFDVDRDGDEDLYVVSGGNEFEKGDQMLQDRLYINNGSGEFERSGDGLPEMLTSGGCVKANDFDGDGDLDLLVGGRVLPGHYPYSPQSYLLENVKGKFKDVTPSLAPELTEAGMVTDAVWSDFNQDGHTDLILVGEWMPVRMFVNKDGQFVLDNHHLMHDQRGWWFSITAVDFDEDGDDDYLLGNLGLNYKYKASEHKPFEIYSRDFDENGRNDIVLGYYDRDTLFPVRGRQCSSQQIPAIQSKFPTFNEFASATLEEIYGDMQLDEALHYQVSDFSSVILENKGDMRFEYTRLPMMAQMAPVNDALVGDFDGTGSRDILIAGNLFTSEVETPRADAGKGLLLKGNGKSSFKVIPTTKSGFVARGDVKKLRKISLGKDREGILIGVNDGPLSLWQINN